VLSIAGRWRITEMEPWDQEATDLVEPAFIEFGEADETGNFGFIAVRGWMDCRDAPRDGYPGVDFSWEGSDDCGPALAGRPRWPLPITNTEHVPSLGRRISPSLPSIVERGCEPPRRIRSIFDIYSACLTVARWRAGIPPEFRFRGTGHSFHGPGS